MIFLDPVILFSSLLIIKLMVVGYAVKVATPKPLLPTMAIIGFLTALYTYFPNQAPNLPENLKVILIRFFLLLPLLTLILSVWSFKKAQHRWKRKIVVAGTLDAFISCIYVFSLADAFTKL